MQGPHYFYTGVSVRLGYAGANTWGWSAKLAFQDAGFCSGASTDAPSLSTEGELYTRYNITDPNGDHTLALSRAVKSLMEDAARLGIRLVTFGVDPHDLPADLQVLYDDGAGWDEDWDHDCALTQDQARAIVAAVNREAVERVRAGQVPVTGADKAPAHA